MFELNFIKRNHPSGALGKECAGQSEQDRLFLCIICFAAHILETTSSLCHCKAKRTNPVSSPKQRCYPFTNFHFTAACKASHRK